MALLTPETNPDHDVCGPTRLPTLNRAIAELQLNRAGAADLRSLVLEMGHVIRSLDENHEHLEFWTQDGEYILDGRFPAP
jgi:hypothetical protein